MKYLYMVAGFLLLAGQVLAADGAYLVKIEGFDRTRTWEAMSERDFLALKKTIAREKPLFSKAVEQAARDWVAENGSKGKAFPGSRLKCRAILTSISFSTLEKAEAQRLQYLNQEARNEERRQEKLAYANKHTRLAAQAEKKKDEAQEALMTEAATLVKAKMDILLNN